MKIAISGPHGCGKTTLVDLIRKSGKLSFLEILPETTRNVLKSGHKLNEDGDILSQLLVIAPQIQNALIHDNAINTRAAIDGYVYTKVLFDMQRKDPRRLSPANIDQIRGDIIFALHEMVKLVLPQYTKIFYLPAEFALEEDGVRSGNPDYHKMVVDEFERIYQTIEGRETPRQYDFTYGKWREDFGNHTNNVIRLTGSSEERLIQIEKAIG